MAPMTRRHGPVRRTLSGPAVGLVLGLALTSTLAACSGDDDEPGSGESSAGAASPYLPVPDGVELTPQGSELALGDRATVAYELNQVDQVAVVDMTVTRIDKATFKLFEGWKLSDETKSTTPYFVHVDITNVGDTDLGRRPVSLYAVDGDNTLVEASTFQSVFKPCDGAVYPKKFGNGASTKACLVYLAPDHGEVTAASFRPTEAFNPIVWTGEITTAEPTTEPSKKPGKKDQGKQG